MEREGHADGVVVRAGCVPISSYFRMFSSIDSGAAMSGHSRFCRSFRT